jgi:lactam utilization protein B
VDIPKGDENLVEFAEKVGLSLSSERGIRVTLDEVAEALGERASDTAAVSALLDYLESRGVDVDAGPSPDLIQLLRNVLQIARSEKTQGRKVQVGSIAEKLQMEPRLVRVALLYAEVLMRG